MFLVSKSWEESYTSAEMQSVYSTNPANWAEEKIRSQQENVWRKKIYKNTEKKGKIKV